ncbi:DUF6075 family protein [Clostridium sp. DJ247]|uniref:DUF6075 family protein n=1 Tax=Clostridium sp. DJ247 TaxID=2726188 RepID=UPI0016298235|nr:DUF6075 family protein [Clostridium sp. DJ247]MBC2580594.1 hypothetical protein [Clostridium sp. DJ247]
MKFLSKEHEERFNQCILKDRTASTDVERYALFYILSGSKDIWRKGVEKFYSFENQGILKSGLRIDLCTSSRASIKLAFNLYNGATIGKDISVMDIFTSLDTENKKLALTAIEYRVMGCK